MYMRRMLCLGHVLCSFDDDLMSVLVSCACFNTATVNLFWDLPGDVLAASASALCDCKSVILFLCDDETHLRIHDNLIGRRHCFALCH